MIMTGTVVNEYITNRVLRGATLPKLRIVHRSNRDAKTKARHVSARERKMLRIDLVPCIALPLPRHSFPPPQPHLPLPLLPLRPPPVSVVDHLGGTGKGKPREETTIEVNQKLFQKMCSSPSPRAARRAAPSLHYARASLWILGSFPGWLTH